MDELESLLDLEACDCGREWCQFFNPAEGEWGASHSRKYVEGVLKDLPKVQKHFEKLLKESSGVPKSTHTKPDQSVGKK